jgi:hypothetical protein
MLLNDNYLIFIENIIMQHKNTNLMNANLLYFRNIQKIREHGFLVR